MRTLFYGGAVLPMDSERVEEALLVQDGFIAACGKKEQLAELAPDARRIDLQGAALLPAFIDGHGHITGLAQTMSMLPLDSVKGLEEIAQRFASFCSKNQVKPGQWVVGFGYDQNLLAEKRHPTVQELDRISPERPLMLSHASGHMGVLNSSALQALGITGETSDPPGGKIGRDPQTGELNGYLEETAFTTLAAQLPVDQDGAQKNVRKAQEVYFSYGIATVHEGLTKSDEWELLHTMARKGKLTADVIC